MSPSLVDQIHGPLLRELERTRLAIGRQESHRVATATFDRIHKAEFQVFSQFGEDGIIQYLIHHVPIEHETFIEFGVEDYSESNTRFLLENDNWSGLVLDAGSAHIAYLAERGLNWRHTIDARSAFITPENINGLISDAGFSGDVGLLSIDIDGNDYWVLEAISVVSPRILIVEYNSTFGAGRPITVPYTPPAHAPSPWGPMFNRTAAHWSNLYWGASLPALCWLARRKGYRFVGSNSAGNNAFFVREDVAGSLPDLTARDGYVASKFRESRDIDGRLTLIGPIEARLAVLQEQIVFDVEANSTYPLSKLPPPERPHDST